MQTIGEVFSVVDWNEDYTDPENVLGLMTTLGYGYFDSDLTKDVRLYRFWDELIAEVHKSVDERAALPSKAIIYVQIMNSAKDRFNKSHKPITAPPCWLATITDLKKVATAEEIFPDKI